MTADPLSLTLATLVAEHVTGDWTVLAIMGGTRLTPAAIECVETVCDVDVSAQTVIIVCERNDKEGRMKPWKSYRKKQLAEMRPYVAGEPLDGIAINDVDRANGSPKAGDLIARNPANHDEQWLVSAKFVTDNYEPA